MAHVTLDTPDPRDPGMIERDSVPTSNPAPTVPGSNSAPVVNQTPRVDVGDMDERPGYEIIEHHDGDDLDNRFTP